MICNLFIRSTTLYINIPEKELTYASFNFDQTINHAKIRSRQLLKFMTKINKFKEFTKITNVTKLLICL